jgi:hypothetical protein
MNEWTLPVPAAHQYGDMVEREKREGRWETSKPFVRGGIWRNFFMRFPESNWMHKRMLALSARYHALPDKAKTPAMLHELYEAQANDAYWHGLFGGLYLPHLRRAVWNNLIALEAELDAIQARAPMLAIDLDLDGKVEILAHTPKLQLVLRDDGLAAAHELSSYPLRHNFGDTLRRYREHYHAKIGGEIKEHSGEGIASAHDIVRFKHPINADDIVPDEQPRVLWQDALNGQTLGDYQQTEADRLHFQRCGIDKRYSLSDSTVTVNWHFDQLAGQLFTTTLNLAMPSCDGVLGRYVLADGVIAGGFGQALALQNCKRLSLDDGMLGGVLHLSAAQPVEIRCQPHHTVSQSEAGFEKIMQAAEISIAWTMPDDDCSLQLQLSIERRRS